MLLQIKDASWSIASLTGVKINCLIFNSVRHGTAFVNFRRCIFLNLGVAKISLSEVAHYTPNASPVIWDIPLFVVTLKLP